MKVKWSWIGHFLNNRDVTRMEVYHYYTINISWVGCGKEHFPNLTLKEHRLDLHITTKRPAIAPWEDMDQHSLWKLDGL